MLVPAFAFAWWLVSLPAALPHPPSHRDVRRAQPPVAAQAPADATGGSPSTDEEDAVDERTDSGWRGERVAVKVVTQAIVRTAQSFLDLPMGDERFVEIDGRRYVFVLERHYHPPGFVGGPTGWHKGVTAYELR